MCAQCLIPIALRIRLMLIPRWISGCGLKLGVTSFPASLVGSLYHPLRSRKEKHLSLSMNSLISAQLGQLNLGAVSLLTQLYNNTIIVKLLSQDHLFPVAVIIM